MRLAALHLQAFGHFTDAVLEFGTGSQNMTLVFGANEAGKSTTLRAISDLRFGIPHNSGDGFRHAYADMRIGGVFRDAEGVQRGFVRLKRRNQSLLWQPPAQVARRQTPGLIDLAAGVLNAGDRNAGDRNAGDHGQAGEAAPAEIEALLNGGLSRDEYEAMFSLDHARLRAGGEALLQGQGDIGAALFEASAGVRSVPAILEQLERNARRFYVPGSRGRNAPINEALHELSEQQAVLSKTTVRPALWTDLHARFQQAQTRLADARQALQAKQTRLMLVKELRAVAPLLDSLDQASARLAELIDAPLLADDAPALRVAAQSALAVAAQQAHQATAQAERCREQLRALQPDPAVLALASAIDRLLASIESIESLRSETAAADADVDLFSTRSRELLQSIGEAPVQPTAVRRAEIDHLRQQTLLACQTLAQHVQAIERAQLDGGPDAGEADEATKGEATKGEASTGEAGELDVEHPARAAGTAPTSIIALRAALDRSYRLEAQLSRLDTLPADIAAAQRQWQGEQSVLGLNTSTPTLNFDEPVADDLLATLRPMLDADIDAAIRRLSEVASRQSERRLRIGQIDEAVVAAQQRREGLMAAGALVTPDDVRAARSQRDRWWRRLRGDPEDSGNLGSLGNSVHPGNPGAAEPSRPADVDAYLDAVREADRLVDELARDAERSTRLQTTRHELSRLTEDRFLLIAELEQLASQSELARQQWSEQLSRHGLPDLEPDSLREWQARLTQARASLQRLRSLQHEQSAAQRHADELAGQLRLALRAAGHTQGIAGAGWRSLVAMASQVDQAVSRLEREQLTAAGVRQQQQRQHEQMARRQRLLEHALAVSLAELRPMAVELGLSVKPTDGAEQVLAVVAARLREVDALGQTGQQLDAARHRHRRALDALEALNRQAQVVAQALGEPAPPDPRLFADAVARRLAAARVTQSQQALIQQALEQALGHQLEQQAIARDQRALLRALCAAAGVSLQAGLERDAEAPLADIDAADVRALAQAEHRSSLRRAAQYDQDRARGQLAAASRRDTAELRALLQAQDGPMLQSEEADGEHELVSLEAELNQARLVEETARRALEAIDGSDVAASAREAIESAAAGVRRNMLPWIRSRLSHALLTEALRRFRDRAQGPMLNAASAYFLRMTDGNFVRLISDDQGSGPILLAERRDGSRIRVDVMSEGTRDQLYLALRLAALDIRRREGIELPVILDDVLMTSDDHRAALTLQALCEFSDASQVILFTHHRHLLEVARNAVPPERLRIVTMPATVAPAEALQ